MGATVLLRIAVLIMRVIPWPIVFMISGAIAILLHRVVRYRAAVVSSNLRRAFAGQPDSWYRQVASDFYLNLADNIFEQLKVASMSNERLYSRIEGAVDIAFDRTIGKYGSAIILVSHTANWEWASRTIPWLTGRGAMSAYKPVKNNAVDNFLKRNRSLTGIELVPMQQIVKRFLQHRGDHLSLILVADQSPASIVGAHMVRFFDEDVPFSPGGGIISHKYDLPVFYMTIERVGRARYRHYIELLCDKGAILEPRDVTQLYARKLEEQIRRDPSSWLWSHRRWKRVPATISA